MESNATCQSESYNKALQDPTVRMLLRFAAEHRVDFNSSHLILELYNTDKFPTLSVAQIIKTSRAAGIPLSGAFADIKEASGLARPFLTYLRRDPDTEGGLDLVLVDRITNKSELFALDGYGQRPHLRNSLANRWSGVILYLPTKCEDNPSELLRFRDGVRLLPDVLSPSECSNLIDYCETACFSRSRVVHWQNGEEINRVDSKIRSSSSVVLDDRQHPILSRLYQFVAEAEGVNISNIETIQCVRYKKHQKFQPHFDAGLNLPRRVTYLLYLNDNFEGGETIFPMLNLTISPQRGSCLRFDSCDAYGRILWVSEHGGLPVSKGVKYALNIWIRSSVTSHR